METHELPLATILVVEDGPAPPPRELRDRFADRGVRWIATGQNVGQIAAIDYAYSRVGTPYVFHLEDDWEFYRAGYMERSLRVLESNPKCLQVWIRATGDTQRHPVEPYVYVDEGVAWQRMALHYEHKGTWNGFTFNPGLRRLADYVAIGGYGVHARFHPDRPNEPETILSQLYRRHDCFAAILADDGGAGYVRHLGDQRHVGPVPEYDR